MKARDVVPGWPRGRSTSVHSPDEPGDMLIWGRCSWSTADYEKLKAEVAENHRYHQQQAAMLNQFGVVPSSASVPGMR